MGDDLKVHGENSVRILYPKQGVPRMQWEYDRNMRTLVDIFLSYSHDFLGVPCVGFSFYSLQSICGHSLSIMAISGQAF